MQFVKLQGYGNDYIVIEAEQLLYSPALPDLARAVCDRHYGAGADGIALVGKVAEESADFSVRIFNPDGSEAAMSGNGTRCAAAYLYHQGFWTREELRLTTRAGLKNYQLLDKMSEREYRFAAEIGRPRFASEHIPLSLDEPRENVVDFPLDVDGMTVLVTALEMCNPNCCLFVDDFAQLDWRAMGRAIETHARFPQRTNVEFIRVLNLQRIEIRIWERGAGETLSSGTGACAAAIASMINGRTERRITVETPGGQLQVEWRAEDDEVVLTGTASVVYSGQWAAGSRQ